MFSTRVMACVAVVFATLGQAQATVLDFEGYAPAGGQVNVAPSTPYAEEGYALMPSNVEAAVFDAGSGFAMIGNSGSDWFGFHESNTITLTYGAGAFNLHDLLLGPSTIAGASSINMTLTGFYLLGGSVATTYTGLSTATLVSPNWANLASVQFTTTDDAGLDNIQVSAVPEPGTLALLGFGALGLAWRRRRGD